MKQKNVLVAGLLLLLVGTAHAEMSIGLGGETLFVLKADRDLDKTDQERSDDVYDRLRNILNNPRLKASDIQVKALGDYGYKIVANGHLIVPIGVQEAKAHDSTPLALAEQWAVHLRKVMPKLRARPDLFRQKNKYVNKTNKNLKR
ncbi:hypothetical protein [Armatimonas sp.]|uniref:hypothetical protein n=1 Tax=Armatimonas sp. TaxID=1872638 RepID=UPI003752A9F3